MALGQLPSNEDQPYSEYCNASAWSDVIPNGGGLTKEFARLSMSWAGTLNAEFWVNSDHPDWQYIVIDATPSSPAPTWAPQRGVLTQNLPTDIHCISGLAQWSGLAAGTFVIVNIRISVGGGGPNVTGRLWGINLRAFRS